MIDTDKLFDKNILPSARKIAANPDIVAQVIAETSWLLAGAKTAERLWNLSNGKNSYSKMCERCGEPITSFRSWTEGYSARYCSRICQGLTGRKEKTKIVKN